MKLTATDLSGEALGQLQEVADTDLALMWIRRDGRFAFRPEGRVNPGPLQGRLVVCPTELEDLQVIDMSRAEFEPVTNIAAVRGGIVPGVPPDGDDFTPPYVTVEDAGSVARFHGRQGKYDLLHDTAVRPDWSQIVAQMIVASQAWPSMAPAEAVLGLASGDPSVPAVLFTLEPDIAFEVVDTGGRTWICAVSGWDMTVGFDSCGGTLYLADVTNLTGGQWDSAGWDRDRWGLGQVS